MVTDDGVRLHVEETGTGTPILFIHEFAGDARSWAPQVAHLSDRYRCVTYNARGYPPSDVPDAVALYSQARAVDDARSVLDGLGIERAHIVGLSMGGFCALHLALRDPERVSSLAVAGCGYGAQPEAREAFRRESAVIAAAFEQQGSAAVAARYAVGPARVQLQNKNPQAWAQFAADLAEHSAVGMTRTMLGVQRERPSLYDLEGQLRELAMPVLIIAGDEDDGCLEPDLMLKRTIPTAGLAVLPNTGHTCNLEQPEVFNRTVDEFLAAVEAGRWRARDPRTRQTSVTGMDDD
ncbi:MAG TPA: alpha/beta fold hydrolase [Solirubrobacteraceae bacterium]|nr:alpha/beta fold hydrolase [Solirubrobacteraceae bacterium]